jgi:tripartite-type tricarboxylate transporter receptor subunit TctC
MGIGVQLKWLAAALAAMFFVAADARADSLADFYRGKTIRVVIGYGPGGGYDIYGRLAAQFLGRFIPGNPTILPVNMPGAASLRAVEYLFNAVPKDGTYLGSVQQALAMTSLVDGGGHFDPAKLPYIGRFSSNIDVAVALQKSGITSFDDLRKREITVGTDETGSMSFAYARILNAYAGAKLEIVKGYTGSNEIQLAAERGEIDVNGSYSLPAVLLSHPDWVRDGTATILYQNALKRFPKIPQTPTLLELVDGQEGKMVARVVAGTAEIGRSILTTPGVPAERLAAVRAAFQDMVKDPEFIAACASRNLMLDPGTGPEMDAITTETMNLPPSIVDALRKLLKE